MIQIIPYINATLPLPMKPIPCPSGSYTERIWQPHCYPLYLNRDNTSAEDLFFEATSLLADGGPWSLLMSVFDSHQIHPLKLTIDTIQREYPDIHWKYQPGMEHRFLLRGNTSFNTDEPFLMIPEIRLIFLKKASGQRVVCIQVELAQITRINFPNHFTLIGSLVFSNHQGLKIELRR